MIGTIGSNAAAVQAYQPVPVEAPAPAPAPAPSRAPLEIPGDADPCTDCGRAEIEQAYQVQAFEQGRIDAQVLEQVAAMYAASRPAA